MKYMSTAFWKIIPVISVLLVAASLLTAQEPAAENVPPQQPVVAPADPVLGPGDQITIRALDLEEISNKPFPIAANGTINLPLFGRVQAAGLTLEQLETEITTLLKPYVKHPDVTISISEAPSQTVSVIGSVNTPGVLQLQGSKTLVEMLSLAGGLRPDAGHSVKITRRRKNGPIPLPGATADPTGQFSVAKVNLKAVMDSQNLEENILIQPNDVISVSRAEMVYVIGDVRQSGGFVLNERETISVLQALSLAGGASPTATPDKAKILRPTSGNSNRTEIPVDLKKILAGQANDVALKSEDILFVPGSAFKRNALQVIQTAVGVGTGIAIWSRY
jgi:polysaccharide export outer membrane protein